MTTCIHAICVHSVHDEGAPLVVRIVSRRGTSSFSHQTLTRLKHKIAQTHLTTQICHQICPTCMLRSRCLMGTKKSRIDHVCPSILIAQVSAYVRIQDLNGDVETCPGLRGHSNHSHEGHNHIQLFENTIFEWAKFGPRAMCRMSLCFVFMR